MRKITNPAQVASIADPYVRALVELRLEQLGTLDDAELIVVEPGDTLRSLEAASGCPILTDPFTETQYGDDGFTLSADALEDHGHVYTMLFVTSDTYAIEIFIPKSAGIDGDLLAMCKQYAQPAVTV